MKIRFNCIFIFLCALYTVGSAQGVFRTADSLFEKKDYRNAVIEYERVVYIYNDHIIRNQSIYKKAVCYKLLGEYEKACRQLLRISFFGTTDSAQFLFHNETAVCSFLAGRFEDTRSQLLQIRQYTKDTFQLKKIYLLEALNFNELEEYSSAKESFSKYFETNFKKTESDSLKLLFAEYFSKSGLPKFKSLKTAAILEYFPGLGLFYAGYPLLGTFNFILSAACLGAGVYEIYYGYYFTGYFVGAAMLSKFYFGGRSLTVQKIIARNFQEKRKFNDKIRNTIYSLKPDK